MHYFVKIDLLAKTYGDLQTLVNKNLRISDEHEFSLHIR